MRQSKPVLDTDLNCLWRTSLFFTALHLLRYTICSGALLLHLESIRFIAGGHLVIIAWLTRSVRALGPLMDQARACHVTSVSH